MKPAEYVPLEGYERYHEDDMRSRIRAMANKLASRRSIRDFASTPVPRDIIETAIRTAGSAPSGANHQPWYFVAISNPDIKRKIRLAAEAEERAFYAAKAGAEWLEALVPLGTNPDKPFLETAPWLIAVFAQRRGGVRAGMNTKNYYVTESVGIATGMLITALHSAGLATLTHTPAPMTFLREICRRPQTEKPFVLLVTGYPATDARIPKHALIKKKLHEISSFVE